MNFRLRGRGLSRPTAVFFVIGLALATLGWVGCDRETSPGGVGQTIGGDVTLVIESGGMSRTLTVADVVDGTTVESVLRSVSPDDTEIQMTGRGLTAFVESIDGRGATGTRGWVYTIDGEKVNTGVGSTRLHPPTTVTWRYSDMDDVGPE